MHIPFKVFLDTQNLLSGYETPKLHVEICDWLEHHKNKERKLLQVFRHAGKSYILCCYVVWRLLCDPNYTCIIISAKRNLALRNSQMIRSIIETNPLTRHLKSDYETWQVQQFSVDRDYIQLNPSVTVTSLQSSFTGMHATEILADDIEVSTNVQTEDAREFIKDRVQEFGKIANQIMLIGTPHHEETIFTHCENIGYKTIMKKPIFNKEGKLAWPDHPEKHFDWDWIERQKAESTEGDWLSQYMLVPSKTYQSLMDIDRIEVYEKELTVRHLPQPMGNYIPIVNLGDSTIQRLVAAWDPATGMRGKDQSVLSIVARDMDGFIYVHDVIELPSAKEKDFSYQCEMIIDVCDKHKVGHVYVEENFSPTLQNELRRTARDKKKQVVIIPEFRQQGKLNFIAQQLEPVIKIGKMKVHQRVLDNSHYMSQLEEFPYCRFDDCIDATAMAISKLPEPAVDVTKIPLIQSPIKFAGGVSKLTGN